MHGYTTQKYAPRGASRAVEYSANDFGVWQVAEGEGLAGAGAYLARSRDWRNHWDASAASLGLTGFVAPRPREEGGGWSRNHSFVALSGGAGRFVERLGAFFLPENGLFVVGNEPSFTTPYLFSFVGRQDLTVATVRRIAEGHYKPTPRRAAGDLGRRRHGELGPVGHDRALSGGGADDVLAREPLVFGPADRPGGWQGLGDQDRGGVG